MPPSSNRPGSRRPGETGEERRGGTRHPQDMRMTSHVDSAGAVARHGAAIGEAFRQSSAVIAALATDEGLIAALAAATETCVQALRGGRKIMFAGNGGSAADA